VPVLIFALGISMVTGLLFGLAPAWKASRTDITEMLRSRIGGGLRHGITRSTLVVVQLALSLVLLATAGLLTRSLQALQRVNPGFDGDNLLTAQFRLPVTKYNTPEKIWEMFERTTTELRSIPGVEAAALVRASPLSQNGESYPVVLEGQQPVKVGDAPMIQINSVTPGYFATMRIPVLAGRDIAATDRADAPHVIVVNKSFAERTWPGQSALGKRIQFGSEGFWTIVGVAGDTKHYTLNENQLLQGYVAHAQRPQVFTSLVVRTKGNPTDFARAVREAVWRVDRDQPIWRFKSMEQDLSGVVQSKKTMMWLTGLFALVALLVAVVGVYGVLSYTVAQRTQEVGIRIALGADAGRVRRMVIGDGLRLVGVAVVVGLALSLGAGRLLRHQLFGIPATDTLTFVAVTAVLGAVALIACYVPARRASRVDPLVALRMD
jgi:predicted permease